ncbi:MAG TPA: restriction endonuclease subunit S [Candidatus Aminicenantes bacterium]|nr:restriction endonuclease subunit S [Candidatus Aminicenantes bacterium]
MGEWLSTTLREVANLNYGKNLPSKIRIPGDVPVYGSNGIVGWHNEAIVNKAGIIVGRKGSVGAIQLSNRPFCPIDTTYFITADDTKVDINFLYYLLRHFNLSRLVSDLIPGLNRDLAYAQEIVVPNTEIEQRRIAAVLSLVQRVIEQKEQLIALTTELKKVLMYKLFTEGTRGEPQKQSEIGSIPEGWEVVKLGSCCGVVNSSISYTMLMKMDSFDSSKAVDVMGVKVSDMNIPGNEEAFINANLVRKLSRELSKKKTVPAGAVVFPKRGAAIATNKKRITTTWTVLDPNLIAVVPGEKVIQGYLYYWSQTFDLRKITDPGPTPQLNKKDVVSVLFPLPQDPDEQREITNSLKTVDKSIRGYRDQLFAMQDLFHTLLHQLMTAEIRVNDLDLEELGIKADEEQAEAV